MVDQLNTLMAWLRLNMDVLAQIGGAIVVAAPALWLVFRYFYEKPLQTGTGKTKERSAQEDSYEERNRDNDAPPPAPPVLDMRGRNQFPKGVGERFYLAYSVLFFGGLGTLILSVVGHLLGTLFPLIPLQALPILLFSAGIAIGLIYLSATMLMSELSKAFGRVRVVATGEVIVIWTMLGLFSDSRSALAKEWWFDGENFISRNNNDRVALGPLPPFIREKLVSYMLKYWRE